MVFKNLLFIAAQTYLILSECRSQLIFGTIKSKSIDHDKICYSLGVENGTAENEICMVGDGIGGLASDCLQCGSYLAQLSPLIQISFSPSFPVIEE